MQAMDTTSAITRLNEGQPVTESITLTEEELEPFRDDPELYAYIKEHPGAARLFLTDLTGMCLVDPSK